MKKLIALMLCIITLLSMCITAHAAYTPQHTEEAEVLYDLGLFKGTGTNADGTPIFALDRQATRIEGLVMLIRLLGEEEDALAFVGECPFVDVPSWAEKYAGYAYAMGYTKGTSATTFSDGPLYSNAFLTFVLRSLGYDDAAGDFSYSTATQKAAEIGIIATGSYADQSNAIYRDDCAKISFNALKTALKDESTTLLDKLVADGVLTEAAVQKSGVLSSKVKVPVLFEVKENNDYRYYFDTQSVLALIPQATYISSCKLSGITFETFKQMTIEPVSVALGSKPCREYYLNGKKPESQWTFPPEYGRGLTVEQGFTVVVFSMYDSNVNLCAYAYAPVGVEITELTFTVCNYNPKEDIKELENEIIKNIKTLNSDTVYFERITTVQTDGTEKKEVYLRLDMSKWPADMEKPFYYRLLPDYSKESLLRDYGNFNSSARLLDVAFDAYGTIPKFDASGENLVIYDEARDVIAYIKIPQNVRVVETKIEQ